MATTEKTATNQNRTAKKAALSPRSETKKEPQNDEVLQLKKQLKQAEETAAKAGQEAQEAKKKAEEVQKQLEARKPINVMDAIVKVYETKEIVSRLEFLRDTKKSLAAFSLGRSELKDELKLSDGNGNVFQTTNSETVSMVLDLLKTKLDERITNTEQQLIESL